MADNELDVRQLRKPDKHPTIFATFAALSVGESFVLVNNHDPKHLHDEFEADHAGSYGWEYLEHGPAVWRIRITKLTATPLPRILTNTADVASAPGGGIDTHAGALLWLPKRSRRQFTAGPDWLRYLTVHQKREILPLTPTVRQAV